MKDARRVKWTRNLVFAGILLGYLSYGTGKLGWGELYPFAHWRLFSAPIGINEPATTFRIYFLEGETETWQRQPLEPTRIFTVKEQSYVLGYWARRVMHDSAGTSESRARLRTVAGLLSPEASAYRVVEESFYSLPVYRNPTKYDTSTVAYFSW